MSASKTPQFDKLLDDILLELQPHTRACAQQGLSPYCEGNFHIEKEDIDFYKMLHVPPPLLCPTCRRQQRFAFVNRTSFYKRDNAAPEGPRKIISYVPPNAPYTIYDYDYYRSANWDPMVYARAYDRDQSFFNQLFGLRLEVPQPALLKDPTNINYEYSLNGRNSKNVYCSSGVFDSEDVWYTVFATKSRGIMDCNKPYKCQNCAYSFFIDNCNACYDAYFSKNCINCRFVYDCRNCQDCFGCVNLRNQKYCFFNEQLSKEAYEQKIKELELDKRSSVEKCAQRFWDFAKTHPVLGDRSTQTVDSTGVMLVNCKNCTNCVSVEKAENERYCDSTISHKDSMDLYASGASELLYQTAGSGSDCANSKFLVISKFITESEYLINCRMCAFCFGCVGLENKKYCIFNKQYEPEDYFKELDTIKTALLTNGEYGEFFPYAFSPFAYNGSDVDHVYPLQEEDIRKLGALYQEDIETDIATIETITADQLPDSVNDVTDDILSKAIICQETGKPFRIIANELAFYKIHSIPLPTVHPYRRVKNRFKYMGNSIVHDGVCESCSKSIKTIYKPGDGWHPYCEACFQREVV